MDWGKMIRIKEFSNGFLEMRTGRNKYFHLVIEFPFIDLFVAFGMFYIAVGNYGFVLDPVNNNCGFFGN